MAEAIRDYHGDIAVSQRCVLFTRAVVLLSTIALMFMLSAGITAAPPKRMLSGMPPTGQLWNLSCEYAATSAATAYFGNRVTQQTLRTEIDTDVNPHKGFRGNIAAPWGGTTNYGVYAEPIAAVLRQHGFGNAYVFYGGLDTLRAEIASDHPVVVWVTGDFSVQRRVTLQDSDSTFALIPREHTVTAYGYDEDGIWVMDPSDVTQYHVGWSLFDRAWAQFDRMALAIVPSRRSTTEY